ncbi:MAG: DUF4974 domain-containing protein [Prevotella sp.]|nr:DUF4974 domain-containing protein [Prevotella sp.]
MKNETINDKRAMLLDMQEHPERYTDDEIQELLADEDVRSFAETLAATKRAMTHQSTEEVDVDAAWQRFADAHPTPHHNWLKIAAVSSGVVFLSGMAWAAAVQLGLIGSPRKAADTPRKSQTELRTPADTLATDTLRTPKDSVSMAPVTFDNAELGTILTQMGAFYHVGVAFQQESSRHIRLYFQWDKHLDLQQQVELLNSFDRISITLNDNQLNVD